MKSMVPAATVSATSYSRPVRRARRPTPDTGSFQFRTGTVTRTPSSIASTREVVHVKRTPF